MRILRATHVLGSFNRGSDDCGLVFCGTLLSLKFTKVGIADFLIDAEQYVFGVLVTQRAKNPAGYAVASLQTLHGVRKVSRATGLALDKPARPLRSFDNSAMLHVAVSLS
jgi:hypothetical protein